MLTRERLWRRLSGGGFWILPWALAAACALPWVVPERWTGQVATPVAAAGWAAVLAAAPLARYRRWLWLPLLLTLVWGTLGALGRQARWETALPAGFQEVSGVLSAPWRVQGRSRVGGLRVEAPRALAGVELPLSLSAGGAPPPEPGTRVTFRGDLERVEPSPAFLPERPLWRARCGGAPRRLHLASALLLVPLGPARPSPLLALRVFMQRRFEALPLPQGLARDLWGALTLGLPPAQGEAFSAFAESGTIHTLVVSGLQVTLVMGGLEALWRRLWPGGQKRSARVAMGGGLIYGALVGFTAPVWRGLLMGAAWAAGKGTGWKVPPVLTLHGALLLWLLTHAAAGAEPGFLLAWLALVGLLWGSEPMAGLFSPVLRRWALPFAQVLAPWLSTLPLLALLHGGAPVWGVPANLALLPLVAFLAPVCLILVLLPLPWVVQPLGSLLEWTGSTLVPWFARVAPLATGVLWPWLALILGWLFLAQAHARFQRTRWLCAALLGGTLVLLATGGTGQAPRALSLEAMDIGQGDALLLRVPGGDATLIDTGPDPRAARRIVRVLSRRGVREPVHLVLTHPHLDHAGGWATLARLWPLASTARPPLGGAAKAWEPYGPLRSLGTITPLLRGASWRRGEAAFSVRWPPRPLNVRDFNMTSAVLRVRWRDRELWFMGDALALQEQDLLGLGEPGEGGRARLLKAGHHGSRSASDPAWVRALAPGVVLVSAGRRNAFDHPHAEAMAALTGQGAQAFVTGPSGGVRVEARPGAWLVETGDGRRCLLPASTKGAARLQGLDEGQAHPLVVGPPFQVGLRPYAVGHSQGRGAGDAGGMAGREDAREFQMLCGRPGGKRLGPFPGPGDGRRHGHGVGGKRGRTVLRGPPANHLQVRPVGAALHFVQGHRHRLRGADQVAHGQPLVIGAAGAHEEHPARMEGREQTRRSHRGRDGPHAGAPHLPAGRWGLVEPCQFRGEGGQEQGGAERHGGSMGGTSKDRGRPR
jgi:competence protein ComEC